MSVANTGFTTAESDKQSYDAEFDTVSSDTESPPEMKGYKCCISCPDATGCN